MNFSAIFNFFTPSIHSNNGLMSNQNSYLNDPRICGIAFVCLALGTRYMYNSFNRGTDAELTDLLTRRIPESYRALHQLRGESEQVRRQIALLISQQNQQNGNNGVIGPGE